jgi:hypothetical protein
LGDAQRTPAEINDSSDGELDRARTFGIKRSGE